MTQTEATPQSQPPLDEEARWVTLHVHGREAAVEEGILRLQTVIYDGKEVEIAFTSRLSPESIKEIAQHGLDMLDRPQCGDSEYQRLRLVSDDVLLVQTREGITLMRPKEFGGEEASLQPVAPTPDIG